MSANEPRELRAFQELESLVRHLGEELAAFRKRALVAESQLKDAGQQATSDRTAKGRDGAAELEMENEALRTRIARSEDRVRQMLERVRFLRQQLQSQSSAAGASAGVRSS